CARKWQEIYPCLPKKLRNLLNLQKRDFAKESLKKILSEINEESERVSCQKIYFDQKGFCVFSRRQKIKSFEGLEEGRNDD
ncbi:unnamed protein product, partial [Oikopleura dioica]